MKGQEVSKSKLRGKQVSVKKTPPVGSKNILLKASTSTKQSSITKTLNSRSILKKLTVTDSAQSKKVLKTEVIKIKPVSKKALKSPFQTELLDHDTLVVMPQNMSIRAREKALALLQYFRDDFDNTAKRVSTISGFAFILFGSYLALTFSGAITTQAQFAQLVTSLTSTTSTTISTPLANTTATQSLFSIIDKLPAELLNNQQFTISLTNAKNVQVKAISLADGTIISINSRSLSPDAYQYDLEKSAFKPGYYTVKVFAESSVIQTRYTYTVGDFKIPLPVTTTPLPPPPVTASSTTQQSTASPTVAPAPTNNPAPIAATTTTLTTEPTQPIDEVLQPAVSRLKLSSNSNLSGQASFRIEAPSETTFLEVYARPIKSINTRFLGLAEKRIDAWYYFFNSINVPNGDYEVHARSRISNTFIDSNSVNVRISNFVSATTPKEAVSTTPVTENPQSQSLKVESTPPVRTETVPLRTFSDAPLEKVTSSSSPVHSSVSAIFETYKTQLNDLLRRYAVAHQTGDEALLRTVESEIKKLKQEILTSVLEDSSKNALAHGIEEELGLRIDSLKSRINTFEDLRRTSSQEDIRKDTDGDGVSDFDENNLYHTDVHQPDSDNDGFTDGIEVMRGFNPNDPAGEATVSYELPQETIGLEVPDLLKIDEVLPSIMQTSDTASTVQSEIHGKGLPNSYVTLYIFSTPTIVTVRTDADGSFVYTFEKELEDGEHQVYAAVTDNTGNIVAQSSPFRFIKEAQAYTPTNEAGSLGVNSQTLNDYKKFNLYNTVIGVGILGLGIILLMLGFGIGKRKDEEAIIITENDPQTA